MNKELIYKYLRNQASAQEIDSIIEWVKQSPKNLDFFAEQKALWEVSGDIFSQAEYKPKVTRKKRLLRFAYFSAAAVVALLLTINLWFTLGGKETQPLTTHTIANLHPDGIRTLYTDKGVKAKVILPDSSIVWLNSDSRITYPALFNGETRDVELSGEAYFEVVKDSIHPMIVKTNKDFSIVVHGTKFSVKSYDNDDVAKATLFSGSISMNYKDIKNNERKTLKLQPSESFLYYSKDEVVKPIKYKNNQKEIAWKDGDLLFDQTPLPEVLKMLERWHGSTFIIDNPAVYNNKLTASFKTESIVQIMEMIKYCIEMDYTIKDNVVRITSK